MERVDRWSLTLAGLRGDPWPALPDLPGRIVLARDEPLPDDELAEITDPRELALCSGVTLAAARARLAARGAA